MRCPHLSCLSSCTPHAHGVFRDTSPSLADAEAVHGSSHSVSLGSCCHVRRLGGTSALRCIALLCTRLRCPKAGGMDTGTWVQGSPPQCCMQVVSQGMLLSKSSDLGTLCVPRTFMVSPGTAVGICAHSGSSHPTHTMCMLTIRLYDAKMDL